jgi:Chaperone of endosialidase
MRSVRAASATILSVLLIMTSTARAQTAPAAVPRVMNLAGVFQPVDGQPLRAVETVTVALYTDPTGGTPLWQETQSVAVDSKGRYAFLLGAASAEGIPPAVLAAGARWLGTTFDRPGEVESPRVPLTSVPYALRAADAETLGGHPASAYLLAPSATSGKGGTSTTGKGSPATTTGQASTTGADAGAPSAVVQPGTTNFLAKYVNAADVGNSALYEINGNVGLGTTTPFDLFHVRFTNTAGSLTGFAVQNLGNTATSYSGMLFYDQNGALGQFQGFNNVTHEYRINNIAQNGAAQFNGSINFMVGSTSRFLVTSAGNIGIGTTSPSAVLDVSNALIPTSSVASIAATSYGSNFLGSEIVGRKARGTAAAPTGVLNGDALAIWGGKGYGATGFSSVSSGISMVAGENWTDAAQGTFMNFTTTPKGTTQPVVRMTLDFSGNLGLGTTFPNLPGLEVSNATTGSVTGNITATSYTGTNAGGSLFIGRHARGTAGAPSAIQNGDNLVGFLSQGYGATGFSGTRGGMFVQAAENWTDTAQGTRLNFNTTATGTIAPGTKMVVDPAGNVGIGTQAPSFPLEIARTAQPAAVTPQDSVIASTAYTNGTGTSSFFIAQTARGTAATPAAVQLGDLLGGFGMSGFGATSFNDIFAAVLAAAAENFTDTARGTALAFGTTPLGTKNLSVGMALLPSGNVIIDTLDDSAGIPTTADKLTVVGDVRVGTTGTNGCLKNFAGTGIAGTCASDRRFKKNITPFGPVLDRFAALQPVYYNWRASEFPERHFGEAQTYGLVAQDVEQVLPDLVVTGEDGFKAIDYSKLPMLTIEAVKELKAENEDLKAENEDVKRRLVEVERLIAEMLATASRR